MGSWAKSIFGVEKLPELGVVFAGTGKKELEKEILGLFDEIIVEKDTRHHAYIARKKGKDYPLVFSVYGAPAMVDLLSSMHDGGCRTVIFIGQAYGGFKNLDIGSIVLCNKSYHFDGIYHPVEPDRSVATPNREIKKRIEDLLKKEKIKYVHGTNISVPAVTFQRPHSNDDYRRIKPDTVEMELASCLSRSRDIGIRSAGILIVSDNRKSDIRDEEKRRVIHDSQLRILNSLIDNLPSLKLPALKSRKVFTINKYLANIIYDPLDPANVYYENHKKSRTKRR